MDTRKIFVTLISALALSSCVSKADPDNLNYIGFSASVGKLQVKSEGTKETLVQPATAAPFESISSTSPLNAKLLFSFYPGDYVVNASDELYNKYFGECSIPCHTDVSFSSADYEFIKKDGRNLTYPSGASVPVYCAGLYPQQGWTISNKSTEGDNPVVYTQAVHAVDGTTDIMYSEVIAGSWTVPFTSQNYKHLQAWVKVLVSANTNDAASKWGNITKITIQSESNVNVLYGQGSGGACDIKYTHTVEGDEQIYTDLLVYSNPTTGFPLNITTSQLGSVFVVPPADCILDLVVYTTVFHEGKHVKVKLYDLDNNLIQSRKETIGKLFVLNLNFTNIDVIEGVCTLNYWNDQDDDLYLQ